ncbi:hypothetical protein CUMW_244540 [Citrus unshiu]|uniref:Uncharacterized protein n=1 Tax=Citrus unshiu TaxID=55188 RepID=A0A2H5QNP7_CITUN|nr:hypothetical protein CUMW_244540 [Citrus unshiu]
MLATQESVPIRKPKSSRTANSSFTPSPSLSLRQRSSGIKASISVFHRLNHYFSSWWWCCG